jgi:hypothetical protein
MGAFEDPQKSPSNVFKENCIDEASVSATENSESMVVEYNVEDFWDKIIMGGISEIWPRKDCWILEFASSDIKPLSVPFHKLSQWLTYSLMEAIEATTRVRFTNGPLLTRLAEYRNGGFFIDSGVICFTEAGQQICSGDKKIPQEHALIVEWRALTVCLLDRLATLVRTQMGLEENQLPLAKVLEAGTWKAGREIALRLRPETGAPPISIQSDGTLF